MADAGAGGEARETKEGEEGEEGEEEEERALKELSRLWKREEDEDEDQDQDQDQEEDEDEDEEEEEEEGTGEAVAGAGAGAEVSYMVFGEPPSQMLQLILRPREKVLARKSAFCCASQDVVETGASRSPTMETLRALFSWGRAPREMTEGFRNTRTTGVGFLSLSNHIPGRIVVRELGVAEQLYVSSDALLCATERVLVMECGLPTTENPLFFVDRSSTLLCTGPGKLFLHVSGPLLHFQCANDELVHVDLRYLAAFTPTVALSLSVSAAQRRDLSHPLVAIRGPGVVYVAGCNDANAARAKETTQTFTLGLGGIIAATNVMQLLLSILFFLTMLLFGTQLFIDGGLVGAQRGAGGGVVHGDGDGGGALED